jgi:hypothetical protein
MGDELLITIKEAKHLSAMDKTGTSDPYVRLSSDFNAQTFKTTIIYKTLAPKWNDESFMFFAPPKKGKIRLTMWDKDRFSKDDFLGEITIKVGDLPLNTEVDEWYTLENEPEKPTVAKKDNKAGQLRLGMKLKSKDAPKKSDKAEKGEKKQMSQHNESEGKLEDTYDLGKELGRGGFSVVHLGKHKQTGDSVAIKIINKTDTPEVRTRCTFAYSRFISLIPKNRRTSICFIVKSIS